jgi:hypothetical protein
MKFGIILTISRHCRFDDITMLKFVGGITRYVQGQKECANDERIESKTSLSICLSRAKRAKKMMNETVIAKCKSNRAGASGAVNIGSV